MRTSGSVTKGERSRCGWIATVPPAAPGSWMMSSLRPSTAAIRCQGSPAGWGPAASVTESVNQRLGVVHEVREQDLVPGRARGHRPVLPIDDLDEHQVVADAEAGMIRAAARDDRGLRGRIHLGRTDAAIQHLNSCSVKTVMPCRPLLPDVAKTWYAPR